MKVLLKKCHTSSKIVWIAVFLFSLCLSHNNAVANVLKDTTINSSEPKETKLEIPWQTIRGQVIDEDSKLPLIGVTVMIQDSSPPMGAITNTDGNFRIEKVPVGRVNLLLSYIGYEQKVIPNIVVNSAKEVVLKLTLHEHATTMSEVTVVAQMDKGTPINDMALVGARSISQIGRAHV